MQSTPLFTSVSIGIDSGFRDLLAEQAQAEREHLDAAIQERVRLDAWIETLRRRIDGLNHTLAAYSLPTIDTAEAEDKGSGFATPGNRSDSMPARRAAFSGMSLKSASMQILFRTQDELHADDLARQIFDVSTVEGVRRAKSSLVSTLASGVRKGLWDKGSRPNTYRLSDSQRMMIEIDQVFTKPDGGQ